MALAQHPAIQFHRIRITRESISELDGRILMVTVRRADIRRVQVVEDVVSEHPAFSFLWRFVCIALPVWGLATLAGVASGYRILMTGVALLAFTNRLLASVRRGLVLRIETCRGTKKLELGEGVTPHLLPGFVEVANSVGLAIEVALPVAMLAER